MLAVCAAALTAAFAAAALKKYSPETSAVIALAGGAMIFTTLLIRYVPVLGQLSAYSEKSGLNADYSVILIKTAGICALCSFTADCCRDNGQQALASRVELGARLTIITIALPLFENILQTASSLLTASQ